jgi:acetoin utilization deacetylase AcuC-like enzyme
MKADQQFFIHVLMAFLLLKKSLQCFHPIRIHPSPATSTIAKRRRNSARLFSSRKVSAADEKITKIHEGLQDMGLVASRFGKDPTQNRFHSPIVHHENYSFDDWPPNHTFPMDKFDRIAHALKTTCSKSIPGSNLPRPLVLDQLDFFRPFDIHEVPREWFTIIDADFVDRFLSSKLTTEEARYIGFREQTYRKELIERTVLEVAGTVLCCQLAYNFGIACNVAGGTHHASPTGGAGYTILNDLAVATNFLTDENLNQASVKGVQKVLVIDCDVHQGDGTAKFSTAWASKLYTLSLHCASNYPRLKAHSTYDVGLEDGLKDDEYLQVLEKSVNQALAEVEPDFVLYDAGVDVYEHDKLGRLKLTEAGIRRRDRWVLDRCVSLNIPVAAVVGGGYDKDVDALARRHAIVHEECAYVWRKYKMWKRYGHHSYNEM